MKRTMELDKYLTTMRERRARSRSNRKKKSIKRSRKVKPAYSSAPIRLLNEYSDLRWRGSKHVQIKIPEVFSVINNPLDTVKTYLDLSGVLRSAKLRTIWFDHSNMTEVDLAAESILDLLAMEMRKEYRSNNKKLIIGGDLPKSVELKRYIKAVGIIKNLEVKDKFLSKEEEGKLEILQMRNKKQWSAGGLGDREYKEKAVFDFVEHIDSCLAHQGRMLTAQAKVDLSLYTGEIIDNVEEHTEQDDWVIVGYLDTYHDEHMCEIAIFNFGKTYADTFKELDRNSYAWREVAPYLELHSKKKLFSNTWREEDLLTLISLQGGVSSKNGKDTDDRGQGTVDLIEFFRKVHMECAKTSKSCATMAILSGSTHIKFDGKYAMNEDDSGRKIIAFNSENDLAEQPDVNYVRSLGDVYFPGTIIGIRFPMQISQIERVTTL